MGLEKPSSLDEAADWLGEHLLQPRRIADVSAEWTGGRQERQARKILELAGYHVVKAGGSLGLWDLVALGPQGVRLIQCKSNEKPRPAERERLELFPRLPYCSKEVWVFHDRVRESSIEVMP